MTTAQERQPLLPNHEEQMARARLSLDGLSVGDALGQCFFCWPIPGRISNRPLPAAPWAYTDDTAMAISVVETLRQHGGIEPDDLARRFAERYREEPGRGYGGKAQHILWLIDHGVSWEQASGGAFDGQGSMGNGGAMRAGPVGAYFADDFDVAVANARLSAKVTHAHLEGQAGAVAVAVAAAEAWRLRDEPGLESGRRLIETVIVHTPDGMTREGLVRASELAFDSDVETAVYELGNGSGVVAHDTVPFAVWCAARHLHDYENAFWATVSGLGDRDTTCAIVGSIVAMAVGREGIPQEWLAARESLPR